MELLLLFNLSDLPVELVVTNYNKLNYRKIYWAIILLRNIAIYTLYVDPRENKH